jgi:hypothetical protein
MAPGFTTAQSEWCMLIVIGTNIMSMLNTSTLLVHFATAAGPSSLSFVKKNDDKAWTAEPLPYARAILHKWRRKAVRKLYIHTNILRYAHFLTL